MSGTAAISIIVVVWLFVLAPLALKNQKPIRRTHDALEETRVVYKGGTGDLPRAKKPRLWQRDIRHRETSAENEVMEDVAAEDILIVDDTVPPQPERIPEDIDGEVVANAEDIDTEADSAAEPTPDETDDASLSVEPAAETTAAADHSSETPAAPAEDLDSLSAEDAEPEAQPQPQLAEDHYDLPEYYINPADQLHPQAQYDYADDYAERQAAAEAAAAEENAATAEDADYAFAEAKRGRGWYDPQADAQRATTRYQRRQRTLIILVALCAVGCVLGFGFGGYWWLSVAVFGLLTVAYLAELRRQVQQEKQLRQIRLRHLRRARLGVRTEGGADIGIPQRLRRPGAVVLEIDDDSPDFDYLDTRDSAAYFTEPDEAAYAAEASSVHRGSQGHALYAHTRRAG